MKTITSAIVVGILFTTGSVSLGSFTPNTVGVISGVTPNNPQAADIKDLLGIDCDLFEAYKDNNGGVEEGSYATSYKTSYSETLLGSVALIEYDGGAVLNGAKYLLAKDGNSNEANHQIWYLWDISDWNGTDDLLIENMWPYKTDVDEGENAISHVSIFACPVAVPEASSLLVWGGLAVSGLCLYRRKCFA